MSLISVDRNLLTTNSGEKKTHLLIIFSFFLYLKEKILSFSLVTDNARILVQCQYIMEFLVISVERRIFLFDDINV